LVEKRHGAREAEALATRSGLPVRHGPIHPQHDERATRHGAYQYWQGMRRFLRFDRSADWVQLDVQTAQPYLVLRLLHDRNAGAKTTEIWAEAVCHGDVYTCLATDLGLGRQEAKECWFKLVFAHSNAKSSARDAFDARFPELGALFAEGKRMRHRDLAIRLQQYESHVMLERIVPRLAQLRIPTLTIHDSFIVPMANAAAVERFMSEELVTYTDHPSVIRREGPT